MSRRKLAISSYPLIQHLYKRDKPSIGSVKLGLAPFSKRSLTISVLLLLTAIDRGHSFDITWFIISASRLVILFKIVIISSFTSTVSLEVALTKFIKVPVIKSFTFKSVIFST